MRFQSLQVSGLLIVAALFLLGGCGSSDSSSPAAQTTITGSVFAAPVAGAKVVVLNSTGTTTIAGPVTTLNDGSYSVNIPNSALASDLIISANSGTFTDEATQTDVPSGRLTAYVAGGRLAAGSAVHLDPSSTIIHDLMTSGSGTSSASAETIFNTAFGFTPDVAIAPMNTAATGTANAPNRLAALRAGAFSQLVKDLGFSPAQQFDLLRALALDLADDGILNGSAGSVNGTGIPADIQNKFEQALISFMTNTTGNHTGLTPSDIAFLPFAKVVLTDTYRVEYVPGMAAASQGKTSFKIKVSNRSDGTAAAGLTLKLMPMMHMATMSHATPVDTVVESGTGGTYNCTAYYLMASGPGMGFWDMKIMIGTGMSAESATFHPAVGMAMGASTFKINLNGTMDMATSMTNTMGSKRTYMLFNDGVISGMTSTFNVFIATMESMMNMPAVSGGTILTSPTGTWAVNPATSSLKASLDNTFPADATTVTAVDGGNGHRSLPGLDLSSSMTSTVYVQFTVNSEIKTAGTSSVSSAYGTFAIAPAGGM